MPLGIWGYALPTPKGVTTSAFLWLVIILAFACDTVLVPTAMLLAAVDSLWYLSIGTMTSVLIIVLLLLRKLF